MNYQISQLRKIAHYRMLLVQASKDISQPGQAYKMGILEKVVNSLKVILRLIWWKLRAYMDTWICDTSDPTDLNTKKTDLFRTFQSLGSWPTESRVITGFLQLLGSLGSLVFYLFLVSISFAYTSRNPVTMELRVNASDKNPKPIFVIKRTSGLCEWLLQSVTQWPDQMHHQGSFVCESISRITWINGSVIHFSKKTAPNKFQAYRNKVLSFTLSFSHR